MPQKDPEARREYMRQWKAKNKDRLREKQREYREKNRDQRKEYEKRYYEKNRERILKREADRYRDNEEVRNAKLERARRWAEEHPKEMHDRRRRSWAKTRYGLTPEELDGLLAKGCALCGTNEQLQVDHCHVSGKPRAALCRSCNTGLGHFGDDPARLRAAADYLEKY